MIEQVFALTELSGDFESDLRLLAGSAAGRHGPPVEAGFAEQSEVASESGAIPSIPSVPRDGPKALERRVRSCLPWRSVTDDIPVAMDVVDAGYVAGKDGPRPAGTAFVVVIADNWDAAEAIQVALSDIAGLDDAEWVAGWTRSAHGFREITIFPSLDLAA